MVWGHYGSSGTQASGTANRFVSIGLMIISLLTASIAVEPFLFAALLLEIAAMLVIPLLVPIYQKPGRGVVRFLIYQTIAMPFILFSGWMLAGVEASPGDLGTTTQAGTMLGLGFAFLLAVFPLYNWIPMLMEEAAPLRNWLPALGVAHIYGYFCARLSGPLRLAAHNSTACQRHPICGGFHGSKRRYFCIPSTPHWANVGICDYCRNRFVDPDHGI